MIRDSLPRLVRAVMIMILILTTGGVPSFVAAAIRDPATACGDCGDNCPGCPGGCDSHDCPPQPLCRCAPTSAPTERLVFALPEPLTVDKGSVFAVDTRVPSRVDTDSVFHPPRRIA